MLNYNFITQKAKESKIDNLTIEREYWQLLWLQQIYFSPKSYNLFFKGGTAIRFLFGSFRFSADLDFTSLVSIEEVEKIVREVFSFFAKNSPEEVTLKREKVSKKVKEISCRYRFLFLPKGFSQKISIHLDFSLRERPVTKRESVVIPFDYPITPYPLVVHLSGEEILAEKIRALLVREKARDLFDIWFLLSKETPFSEKILRKKLRLYPGIKFERGLLLEKIRQFPKRELKQDLNQFLPENYRNFSQSLPKATIKLLEKKI